MSPEVAKSAASALSQMHTTMASFSHFRRTEIRGTAKYYLYKFAAYLSFKSSPNYTAEQR